MGTLEEETSKVVGLKVVLATSKDLGTITLVKLGHLGRNLVAVPVDQDLLETSNDRVVGHSMMEEWVGNPCRGKSKCSPTN